MILLKIGLISEIFRDGDIKYNIGQMKTRIMECSKEKFDLICFGESYLQGFRELGKEPSLFQWGDEFLAFWNLRLYVYN